jgi:hypothetical protein
MTLILRKSVLRSESVNANQEIKKDNLVILPMQKPDLRTPPCASCSIRVICVIRDAKNVGGVTS